MSAAKRKRLNTTPIVNPRTGKLVDLEITDRDIAIFEALAFRFHYLSPQWMAPVLQVPLSSLYHRTRELLRPQNAYLRVSPEQDNNTEDYLWGNLFYALDDRGRYALENGGYKLPKRHAPTGLRHQLLIDMPMASFQIAANTSPHLDIIWWKDLAERCKAANPLAIPLPDDRTLHFDGLPFVIKRTFDKSTYMFCVMEADCRTEPLRTNDVNKYRATIEQKVTDYIHILESGTYASHFGAQNFFILFITITISRRNAIIEVVHQLTQGKPHLRKCFLAAFHQVFNKKPKPQPTGYIAETEFVRAGLPPFYFNQP